MTLFTKSGCSGCEYIKRNFDLNRLGVEVKVLDPDNSDALADLAWHGLVDAAEKKLPILVRDGDTPLVGPEAVRTFLVQRCFDLHLN